VRRTSNQTDSDVTFPYRAIKGKSQKRIENYGSLIDFLSQISKLFYFNLLDLADFLMHHQFPVSFFEVATLGVR